MQGSFSCNIARRNERYAYIRKLRLTYRASVHLRRSSEVRVALVGKSQLPDVGDYCIGNSDDLLALIRCAL
jgi:hypothetical protein